MSTNEKLSAGMTLGRYELLLPIAQGGMATVWAARQKGSRGFSKTVAIKTMLPTLSDDAQFEQMFLDEAALAAKIHHPNVAEILDLGEEDEVLYLVMEWIDGEALSILHKASRKNQVAIPQRILLRVAAQACAGLHAAHELNDEEDQPLGLVHRDVSPQNILVTYDGAVKLVDFGVAKAMNRAGAGETTAGQLKGKVPYMSPEQARGGKVDRRTDVFAMGILLYKMTTGIHPFMGDTEIATMRNIISRPLLPPRVKTPTFSAELEGVLVKALQKDPDKRYGTMLELQHALERTIAGMGGGDDDIAGFVRTLMGERGAKRRAAIRDAVREADLKFATGTLQKPVIPQEPISDLVLTKMTTGVRDDLLLERASQSTLPTSLVHTTTTRPNEPMSIAAEESVHLPLERRRKSGIFVVLAGGIALGSIAFALFVTGRTSPSGSGHAAAGTAAAPTVEAPAAPTAATTAAATATADPAPSEVATGSAVSLDDLPNTEENRARAARGFQAPRGGGKPAPSASAAAAAGPSKGPPHSVSTQWVPSVQNPGF